MIDNKRAQERAARIKRRAQDYINGDISLDTFIMLEQIDNDDEADIVAALEKERNEKEAARESAERRKEADKLRDLAEQDKAAEQEEKPEPIKAAPKKREPVVPELVNMTKAEFDALTLAEQQQLYNLAPERVRKIVKGEPSIFERLEAKGEKDRFKNTTAEDFKKMTINDLQALYNADPKKYNELREESRATI